MQVIAGHNCTFVAYNRWACDHLEEAPFPLEAWGTETIVSKTRPPMAGCMQPWTTSAASP